MRKITYIHKFVKTIHHNAALKKIRIIFNFMLNFILLSLVCGADFIFLFEKKTRHNLFISALF